MGLLLNLHPVDLYRSAIDCNGFKEVCEVDVKKVENNNSTLSSQCSGTE